MTQNRIHRLLSRVVDLRPPETKSTLLLFIYFFLITSSGYIVISAKISLFIEEQGIERLPYAYLLTALLIGFFVTLNTKLLRSIKRQVYISISLIFFISNLLLFWWLFRQDLGWVTMVFWFWEDIFIATSVTQFWIFVNDTYHPRQARRLIGFLVSGGLLGGIAGSLFASRLAGILGTENLLLFCPLMLAGCLVIVRLVTKFRLETAESKRPSKGKEQDYATGLKMIFKSRHLLLLSGIMTVTIIVTTLIDFQFNVVVAVAKPDLDIRTSFLGTFFTLLLIFSYVLHMILTNLILRKFGIHVALLIAPVFLLAGSLLVFLIPAALLLRWAVFLKGGDKSLAHSLNQSVRELLYIPVSPNIKSQAKVFIDMFVNKLAKGLGAGLILVFFTILKLSLQQMSLLVAAFTLIWIILNLLITKEYVSIVKTNLKIQWQDADKLISESVDMDTAKLVFDILESRKSSSMLYAMNVFDLIRKDKLSPELKKIINQKSDEIKAHSLDSILDLDGEALLPGVGDPQGEGLDKQVNEILALDVYQDLMKDQMNKIVVSRDRDSEVSRMEAAKLLGMMDPSSELVHHIMKLLKDESPSVVKYALESAGELKKREFVPCIIHHLGNPINHRVAAEALSKYGNKIIGTLKDYLNDPDKIGRAHV